MLARRLQGYDRAAMPLNSGQQRATPRVEIELPVVLGRDHGRPVEGRTRNVGPGGMCVISPRPLAVDEHVSFRLALEGQDDVEGRAHVCREHLPGMYAVRFEQLSQEAETVLHTLASRHGSSMDTGPCEAGNQRCPVLAIRSSEAELPLEGSTASGPARRRRR